jgi:hypothetical protein
MTASARAQLDALDRILALEHVGEEHLELAALVDSVRAGAPRMEPAFRERLDREHAARLSRPSRRLPRPSGGRLRLAALGGGGLVAAAVTFAIVISSGLLGGAGTSPTRAHSDERKVFSSAANTPHHAVATNGTAAPTAGTAVPPAPGDLHAAPAHGSARLVRRNSRLVLATTAASMQRVANEIVTRTEQRGGVVASSNVSVATAGGGAQFSLQIPSPRLGSLIGALSSLAAVRSLNQATTDVTSTYNGIAARLADHRAQAASLRTQLASAPTTTEADALQKKLNGVERRIAAEARALASLLGQARNATLDVSVVPGAVSHHHRSGGGGPLADSFHNALHVLVEMLAVALVVLAIALPFALTGLAVAWSAAVLRQRSRERAIRAA